MAVDRTNSQKQAEQPAAAESRSSGKLSGAQTPVRLLYGADDAPSVRLNENAITGQGPRHAPPPVPALLQAGTLHLP
jgi:hypothetical protein